MVGVLARCRFPDPEEGPVALAVSGGPDSMALMVLARLSGLVGTVIHVEHGLRPGSETEADVVAAVAGSLGFVFERRRVEIGAGPNLEARARLARYRCLPPGVLTGHTMDDQAETVLLNMLRGAALDGLAGMREPPGGTGGEGPAAAWPAAPRPARPAVRRPLLGIRRSETLETCRRAGISPLADPSNDDPRFRRNRVRGEVIPVLNDVAARDVIPVLARSAALAADDTAYLDQLAAGIDPTDVGALRTAPSVLARRAVRAWLRDEREGAPASGSTDPGSERHPPSAAEVERVMEVAAGRRRACQVEGGGRIARRQGRLVYSPPGAGDPMPPETP